MWMTKLIAPRTNGRYTLKRRRTDLAMQGAKSVPVGTLSGSKKTTITAEHVCADPWTPTGSAHLANASNKHSFTETNGHEKMFLSQRAPCRQPTYQTSKHASCRHYIRYKRQQIWLEVWRCRLLSAFLHLLTYQSSHQHCHSRYQNATCSDGNIEDGWKKK